MATSQRVAYDGKAVISLVLGVAALVLIAFSLVAIVLAVAAIVVALRSRQALREDPALAGARVSMLGFVAGSVALLIVAWPLVSSLAIQTFAPHFI